VKNIYTFYCGDGRNAQKVKALLSEGIDFAKAKNATVFWVESGLSFDAIIDWAKKKGVDIHIAQVEGGRDAI
jgi:hypothetical protein